MSDEKKEREGVEEKEEEKSGPECATDIHIVE